MLAFNYVFVTYIGVYAPDCIPLCYVDNIQLVASTAATLHPGILVLDTFIQAWDLSLDAAKSYGWACSAIDRAHLKAFGYSVQLHCRDLGAQMHYARKPAKGVLKQRLATVAPLWTLLRNSLAKGWFRKLAIRVAIWPKVLHSCESAWIPDSTLDQLRSRCMFALKWNRAGASPVVRWSWKQAIGHDPAFVQLWNVLSNFWKLTRQFTFVQEAWMAVAATGQCGCGFLHAVWSALLALQWSLTDDWILQVGPFTLAWFDLGLDTMKILIAHFWQQTMCPKVAHRKDFHGLQDIDIECSFRSFKVTDAATAELIDTIQDGTFCTASVFSKFDPCRSENCQLCGCPDDLKHRCCDCPRFEEVRRRHAGALQRWTDMPRYFTDHGLVRQNPFLEDHWRFLLTMRDELETYHVHPTIGAHFDIFTDGSCRKPTSSTKRLAAWAAIVMTTNQVLSCGFVPGLVQTIEVAELLSVLSVLNWLLRFQVSALIHSDSAFVVDGLTLLRTSRKVPCRWKHQELWGKALQMICQLDDNQWNIHKVGSHSDPSLVNEPIYEWWIAGNSKADAAASRAFQLSHPAFLSNYDKLCKHHDVQTCLVQEQLAFLHDIAKHTFEGPEHVVFDEEEIPLSTLSLNWSSNESLIFSQIPSDFVFDVQSLGGFTAQFCDSLLSYILDLDMVAVNSRYVTGVELLAGFVFVHQGSVPFAKQSSGQVIYEDPLGIRAGGLQRHTIATALRIFRLAVERILKLAGAQFSCLRTNRVDLGLMVNQRSLLIGWPDQVESVVSVKVRDWFSTRPHRKACDLARPLS